MSGLKNIQLTAHLLFEDGVVITMGTPAFGKDIRNGSFFTQEEAEQILSGAGQCFSEIVSEQTLNTMHNTAKWSSKERNANRRKPRSGDNFSAN